MIQQVRRLLQPAHMHGCLCLSALSLLGPLCVVAVARPYHVSDKASSRARWLDGLPSSTCCVFQPPHHRGHSSPVHSISSMASCLGLIVCSALGVCTRSCGPCAKPASVTDAPRITDPVLDRIEYMSCNSGSITRHLTVQRSTCSTWQAHEQGSPHTT